MGDPPRQHVVEHGRPFHHVKGLKDHPDVPAQAAQLGGRRGNEAFAKERHVTGRWFDQAVEGAKEYRLSRARQADDDDELAGEKPGADAGKRPDAPR